MKSTQEKRGKKRQKNVGFTMLGIVISLYLISAVYNLTATYDALISSLHVFKMVLPILLVVIFLMAILNAFIDSKNISKHLGHDSGMRGWIIALLSGLFSHGPGYVWYPILSDLRTHGVRNGLIVTFFYARAIKLPWLPMMISYFGMGFTLFLTFYILLAALIQGIITDRLLQAEINDGVQ